jgi:PAS domain S-box-containing protein
MTKPETIHVLSIEDHPADASLIQETLMQAQRIGWGLPRFEFKWCASLSEGLAYLEAEASGGRRPVDVVLTDLELPDSPAEETFATLRRRFPTLPIVVLTGHEDAALARASVRAGAQDYLYKNEATGSLLAHALVYALERQKIHQELEHRVAERTRALEESVGRFRTLFDNLEDGVFVHRILPGDQPGPFEQVNGAACRMLGYSPEEFSRMTPWDLDDPATSSAYIPEAIEQLQHHGHAVFEAVQVAKGGRKVRIEVNANVIALQGESYILSVVRDIGERKRVEEALRESKERYHSLFEETPISIWEEDFSAVRTYLDDLRAAGVEDFEAYFHAHPEAVAHCLTLVEVIDVNAAAMALYEVESKTELLKQLSDLFVEEAYPRFAQALVGIAAGKTRVTVDTISRTRAGTVKHLTVTWQVVPGYEETLSRCIVSVQDITERKHAREALERYAAQLARSNRDLEQFASVVSHDLREPLRMTASYLQLLKRNYGRELDAEAEEFVDYALDGAQRMRDMIAALLDLARVDIRGQTFAPTDLEAVVARTLMTLEQVVEGSGARVTHTPLPTVMADATQVGQVFQNLIDNALKFRRSDVTPRIHISAEQEDGTWILAVADNGIGLDPDQAERIFEVFQRLHTEEEYPGLGIGLALCRRIVERHGGRMWAEAAPGGGATFYFTLPARPPAGG